jgi:hypothetical protein
MSVVFTSYRPAFAYLPTRMECGRWIWLRHYQTINNGKRKRLYDKLQRK